jgi:tRNA threonylcarbamoyladenosine biosynthesis protein TsaB
MKIHKKGKFFFAQANDIMGYCAIYMNDCVNSTAFITLIAVAPEYQKMKVGYNLLNVSLNEAKSYGMTSCVLEVKKTNQKAIGFYKSNGFVFLSEKKESFFMVKKLY